MFLELCEFLSLSGAENMRIAHLTSAHTRADSRIFIKECRTLANAGYDVSLVVADGKGDSVDGAVKIFDVGASKGRLNRFLGSTRRVLAKAIELDAIIYHFHDPELIPVGLELKRLGKRVVFDAHEDFPKQLLNKPYLGKLSARILSEMAAAYEAYACRRFDGVIAATPSIRAKFSSINPNTIDVLNYPIFEELNPASSSVSRSGKHICYIGGLTRSRGIVDLVRAMGAVRGDVRLQLCGKFQEPGLEEELKSLPGWSSVDYLGYIDREGVRDVLARCSVGIVVVHPKPNHLDSLPIKMFEYMAAGVAVVASDFPLWKGIVEGRKSGVCVRAQDPSLLKDVINSLFDNPALIIEMGSNGKQAVDRHFNWGIEEVKLTDFYSQIMRGCL